MPPLKLPEKTCFNCYDVAFRRCLGPLYETLKGSSADSFLLRHLEGALLRGEYPMSTPHAPEFTKLMTSSDDGTVIVGSSPEVFRKHLLTEITRWRKVAKDYDVKAVD